jgi:hypothetical protein
VLEYIRYPDSIHTILAFYWIQSVLIGVFNFFDILTVSGVKKGSIKINNQEGGKGCTAFFFLAHYGFFHLVYAIFLRTIIAFPKIQQQYLYIAFLILLMGLILHFIKDKMYYWGKERNIGYMMFFPYLRIIPMHLMILIPSFFNVTNYVVFLVLKTIFDSVMHIVQNRIAYKEEVS